MQATRQTETNYEDKIKKLLANKIKEKKMKMKGKKEKGMERKQKRKGNFF